MVTDSEDQQEYDHDDELSPQLRPKVRAYMQRIRNDPGLT
jgi:hypothetical protein